MIWGVIIWGVWLRCFVHERRSNGGVRLAVAPERRFWKESRERPAVTMKLVSSVCVLGASFVLLACSIDTHPTLTSDAGVDAGTHHGSGGRGSHGGAGGASSGGSAMGGSIGSGGSRGHLLDGSLPDRMMGFGGAITMRDGGLADASLGDASMDAGRHGSGGAQGTGGHGGTTGSGGHAGAATGGHAGTGAGGQGTGGAPAMCGNILCDCTLKGINLWGKVGMDPNFPDFVINIDDSFPDLNVEITDFPDSCGQWQMDNDFPDFTVNIDSNEAFPDFTIHYSSFPGVANGP
jgi:hypothetical protein